MTDRGPNEYWFDAGVIPTHEEIRETIVDQDGITREDFGEAFDRYVEHVRKEAFIEGRDAALGRNDAEWWRDL